MEYQIPGHMGHRTQNREPFERRFRTGAEQSEHRMPLSQSASGHQPKDREASTPPAGVTLIATSSTTTASDRIRAMPSRSRSRHRRASVHTAAPPPDVPTRAPAPRPTAWRRLRRRTAFGRIDCASRTLPARFQGLCYSSVYRPRKTCSTCRPARTPGCLPYAPGHHEPSLAGGRVAWRGVTTAGRRAMVATAATSTSDVTKAPFRISGTSDGFRRYDNHGANRRASGTFTDYRLDTPSSTGSPRASCASHCWTRRAQGAVTIAGRRAVARRARSCRWRPSFPPRRPRSRRRSCCCPWLPLMYHRVRRCSYGCRHC